MRIVEVRETTAPISSPIRNAYIDFSRMTLSLVAVITDQQRDGRPVIGYGFHSNGRYAQGPLLRDRFFPRLLDADAEALLDDRGVLDPHRVWATVMRDEKPGGGGRRSAEPERRRAACHDRPEQARNETGSAGHQGSRA